MGAVEKLYMTWFIIHSHQPGDQETMSNINSKHTAHPQVSNSPFSVNSFSVYCYVFYYLCTGSRCKSFQKSSNEIEVISHKGSLNKLSKAKSCRFHVCQLTKIWYTATNSAECHLPLRRVIGYDFESLSQLAFWPL